MLAINQFFNFSCSCLLGIFLVFAAIVAIIVNANFKSDTKTLMNFPDIKKSITTVFIITCYLSVIFIILYAGFHDGPITDYREKCGDIY